MPRADVPPVPWWVEQASALLATSNPESLDLGGLWRRVSGFSFLRDNVAPDLLELDCRARPELSQLWGALLKGEAHAVELLERRREEVASRIRTGELGPERFAHTWQALACDDSLDRVSPAADDYLEGLLNVPRLTVGDERPAFGQVNMASRAQRIADFLQVARPGPDDVVYDLGSGNGKFAVTVAASTSAQVRGVEFGPSYVEAPQRTAARLGLQNARFVCADVRDVDLSDGTHFYLFHPFWGEVARQVAQTLAGLARRRPLLVYLQGPEYGFAEHFVKQVEAGAFRLLGRRGPFFQVLVLGGAA